MVESCLDTYCKMCKEHFNLSLSLEDLKDKGIVRAVNYLEKVVKLENIKSDNRWGKMTIINNIRNDIIHRNGVVVKEKSINCYKEELGIEVVDGRIYLIYENLLTIYDCVNEFISYVLSKNYWDKRKNFLIKNL